MKVTLRDIADRANVSISSVSRALKHDASTAPVHDQTRLRIIQAAKELGYHKVKLAVQKNETEKRIGLVMHLVKNKYNDPYFSEIMYGIESELIEQGCVLDFTFEVKDVSDLDLFSDMDLHGLGVLCVGPVKPALLRKVSKQVPFVFSVGGLLLPDLDCVTVDFRRAAKEAVQHLIRLGHREIAFIGGCSLVAPTLEQEERFVGYREALASFGIPLTEAWIGNGGWDLTQSYEAMLKMLQADKRPTAVFVSSDKMAYGAYKAIQACELSIPEDISVMSFDDVEMSEFMSPGLSTVRVHKEEMGRIAVKLLIQRMEGNIRLRLNTVLPTELIVRGSCKESTSLS